MDTGGPALVEGTLKLFVFLTILLAPLYVVRWNYFGVLPTTLLELLIWAVLVLWGIWKIQGRDFVWPKTPLNAPILLFLTSAVISLFVTPDLRAGLGIFKAYFLEPILFFYILVDLFEEGVMRKTKVIKGLVLSGFGLSVLGIVQVFTHQLIFAPQELGRAHGVFNSGNALALYLGPILVLELQRMNGQEGVSRAVRWVIWTVMFAAFVLTKSQGGWVALAIVVLIWLGAKFLSLPRFKRVLQVVVLGLPAAAVLFLGVVSAFTPKQTVNPWQRPSGSTLQIRFCLWEGTRNLLLEHPVFGAGLSGFKEVYSQKYFTCDAEPLEYPHNLFLTFWVELGFIGLVGLMWVLYTLLAQPSSKYLIIQLSLLYLLVHGMVDVPYFKNDLSLEFWVLAALVCFSDWRTVKLSGGKG